jgi:hypothetical protein
METFFFVIIVDEGHVYFTLFVSYFDKERLSQFKVGFLLIPIFSSINCLLWSPLFLYFSLRYFCTLTYLELKTVGVVGQYSGRGTRYIVYDSSIA